LIVDRKSNSLVSVQSLVGSNGLFSGTIFDKAEASRAHGCVTHYDVLLATLSISSHAQKPFRQTLRGRTYSHHDFAVGAGDLLEALSGGVQGQVSVFESDKGYSARCQRYVLTTYPTLTLKGILNEGGMV